MSFLGFGEKIKKMKNEGCVYTYSVNIDEKKLKETEEQALLHLQAVVSLPGFRAGKVPPNMIKAQFPSMVRDEAIDILAKWAVGEIMKNDSLMPVVTPVLKNPKYEAGKSAYFELQLECGPKVEPKGYEKIQAVRKSHEVTEEEVTKYIDQVRNYNAFLKPAAEGQGVARNHFVIVDYETWENGAKSAEGDVKGEIVDMSAPQTVAGLAEAILGAKQGETREFASPAGDRKLTFKAKVVDIKEKVVPELDDAFLSQAGVKTVDELRASVRKILERSEKERTEKELVAQIEDSLIKSNPMQLPPTLVKEEVRELFEVLKSRMGGEPPADLKADAFHDRLRPVAERNLSLTYLLHHIAKKEKIEATDADLDAELDKMLVRLEGEEEKKKARELFASRREYIRASLVETRTMEFIRSKAVIKEEKR